VTIAIECIFGVVHEFFIRRMSGTFGKTANEAIDIVDPVRVRLGQRAGG
jgi:hypothetical protein